MGCEFQDSVLACPVEESILTKLQEESGPVKPSRYVATPGLSSPQLFSVRISGAPDETASFHRQHPVISDK